MKKEFGNNKWISIEPNIIMAKELIKLYLLYSREIQERLNNSKKHFNKIELTNQKFSSVNGDQTYLTGDLGWKYNTDLYYLGRRDRQINSILEKI